jgi:hypothetical protein
MRDISKLSMTLVTVLFAALGLAGCADGSDTGGDARAIQARDAKALEDQYLSVQGKWEGTVSNPASGLQAFAGELTLYVFYVQDGVNPDLSTKLRPTLRGRFQPRDFVAETDGMQLEGDFDRSGRLVMAATKSLVGGDTKPLAIRGVMSRGDAALEISRQGGVWGVFKAVRTSSDASAPVAGERAELRGRVLKVYRQVEGRYFGVLKARNGNDYNIEIALVVFERPGMAQPVLLAQYKRLDAPAGTLEWSLDVEYNSQNGEIFMRENAASGGSSVPGGRLLSVTGVFKNVQGVKSLDVVVSDRSSELGTVEAIRK